jgi:glycosyltransferase involved in cell wall biosynthesis
MADSLLVSIILPVWNAEDYLDESIQSIINQSYTNWELIICDDASTDNSLSIIKKYASKDKRIIESHNRINQKLLKTRNRLLKLTRGDYITFQDADDYSDRNRIRKQLECFKKDLDLGICGCSGRAIFKSGAYGISLIKPETHQEIKSQSIKYNAFIGSSIMISSKVYHDIGGFRNFFDGLSYQDYDWSCLIIEKYKAYNIPEELYFYRQHRGSASKIIKVDRLLAIEYVRYLSNQRRENKGHDALSDTALKADFEIIVRQLKEPFIKDSSKIYRDYAGLFMYGKLYIEALNAAWSAIKNKPRSVINYKTFLYCLRKSIFS